MASPAGLVREHSAVDSDWQIVTVLLWESPFCDGHVRLLPYTSHK
jgi:hypothetical protein